VKLLLDTHIWVWSFLEPRRISKRIAKLLDDPDVEKWLSPISVWEFLVLVEKGRIRLNVEPAEWVATVLRDFPIREAPLTIAVILALTTVHLRHRDPADAFLVATARALNLTLVTADSQLLETKGISVLANG
jgi:PIN domain nuclease of toxin-antitoxin system